MSRGQSYLISLFRNRTRQNSNTQIRSLYVESRDNESKPEQQKSAVSYSEMAKTVNRIMRERQRWQQTLVSDFPSFDFADPLFFRELLKSQNNVLFSLGFFRWVCSNYDYTPDPVSLNLLFGALLDGKAVKASKCFLDTTGFNPEPTLLEQYMKCLSEEGLVEEAIEVYYVLKEKGITPSIATCNSVLLGCLKARKLDRLWELQKEMIESEIDHERIRCLIQALCDGGEVREGYELLKQGLKQGLYPGHDVYAKLISGFCKIENYACMSEILHTMIAWNHSPNIYTYQEIMNGLCKNKKLLEAYSIFNNLKEKGYAPDRVVYTTMIRGFCEMGWLGSARKLWFEMINKGYAPDRVVYTTMIRGFCEMGWLGSARKLWFEMINKGMRPNEVAYNDMIHGYLRRGEFLLAEKLYSEMIKKGYGETTVSCNTVITGYCSHGKSDIAFEVFKKMSGTGITPDAITYNALIQGFCKENKVEKGIKLFQELKALGLKASGVTYNVLPTDEKFENV